VGSYPTLSPLPPSPHEREAVYSLWHCLWGHPRWTLSSTLPYGARTFLQVSKETQRLPVYLAL